MPALPRPGHTGNGGVGSCIRCGGSAGSLTRPAHASGLCSGCRRRDGSKAKTLSPWERAQAGLSRKAAPTTTHRMNDGRQRQAERHMAEVERQERHRDRSLRSARLARRGALYGTPEGLEDYARRSEEDAAIIERVYIEPEVAALDVYTPDRGDD